MNNHEPPTKADLAALQNDIKYGMRELEDRLTGVVRDTETKLLMAFYDFAKTNQQRVSELESSDAALVRRLGVLEDRLLAVEKRLNMPPAA